MTRQEVAPLNYQRFQLRQRFEIVHRQEVNIGRFVPLQQLALATARARNSNSRANCRVRRACRARGDVRRYLPASLDWLARTALLEG